MRAIREGMRWFLRSGLRWVILALLIVAFLWFVPQLQGEYFSQNVPAKERPALVNEYRRTWAQIIGGFGLLLGLYFTWRRVEISQDQQVTERFTRAIDQLGATDDTTSKPRLEVRLGGIYALERIAWDSPRRDYSTVMEVLTAYVRENTPQAPGPSKGSSEATTTSTEATAEADEGAKQPAPPEPRRPTADIQAILDVLSRAQTRVPEEYRTRLDLHEANLLQASLQDANLRGAILVQANLQEASLQRAILQGASLQGASLQEADLLDANLQGANLRGATLRGAFLPQASLQRANLDGAVLDGAILFKANLQEASLQRAILQGASLQDANLQGAILVQANLQGAHLQGANLRGATLQEADLRETILEGAVLDGAILQRADLRDAKVTDEQLADTRFLQGATMPNGQKYEDWLKSRGEDGENSAPS